MHRPRSYGYLLTTAAFFLISAMACTKTVPPEGTASIMVVNAIAGDDALIFTSNNPDTVINVAGELLINYNDYHAFNSYVGQQTFHFHRFNMQTYTIVDTALLHVGLDLKVGSISTLFLAGTISGLDTLWVKDEPIHLSVADSAMGIRFVNLSSGSNPVSVGLAGEGPASETTSLAYRQITPFRKYAAGAATASMTFEFRDAVSGALLGYYTISDINNPGTSTPNIWRNHNHTLVFDGLSATDAIAPYAAFVVHNY